MRPEATNERTEPCHDAPSTSRRFLLSQHQQPQSLSAVIRLLDLFPIGLGPGRSRTFGPKPV